MRKRKKTVMVIQVVCILILIVSKYLESSITQLAYCLTAFSSPFLMLSFGKVAFYDEKGYRTATLVFIVEFLISFFFVGAMITGMKMGVAALRGFGTLLLGYCLAAILSIVECVASRTKA